MFDLLDQYRVGELHVRNDATTGLNAIIAIHDTRLGPALGGCRYISYPDTDAALLDAVRLARGMSYKAVLAGVPQGGGKSVIIRPRENVNQEALFRCFGRFINDLGGRYITAIDSGTSAREMDWISRETHHVTSTSQEDNPSVYTAQGVFEGIRAAVAHQSGSSDLRGIRVVIQGIGNVGYRLCQKLHQAGAVLFVSDINPQQIRRAEQEFNAQPVSPDEVYATQCEVFAPCGLGAVINDQTLPRLRCSIVAGSANNQLEHPRHGEQLHQAGILYAPDYVINSGGLIYASLHHLQQPATVIADKTARIADTLREIFTRSAQSGKATSRIADEVAEQRLYQKLSAAA